MQTAAHFVEEKITVAVRQAERNGDTVHIARQVKEAAMQASGESIPPLPPTNQAETGS